MKAKKTYTILITMLMITTVFTIIPTVLAADPTGSANWQETSASIGDTIHADFTWSNAKWHDMDIRAAMYIKNPDGDIKASYGSEDADGSKTLEYTVDMVGTWTAEIEVHAGSDNWLEFTDSLIISPIYYTLTVNTQGSGTVSLSPSGGTYESGTVVTLTANPASGWYFDEWSGDKSGSINPTTITMSRDKSVTAHFTENDPEYYTLTVNTQGCGDVTPPGGTYEEGTPVTITADPCTGWKFDHWSGDATGTTNPKTITMNKDKTITAHFVEQIPQGEYYALLLGVGDYNGDGDTDDEDELPCPEKDANDMKEALEAGANWQSNNIKKLTDQNANKDNILNRINWLLNIEDENDISVIYFAGHGTQISDEDGDEDDEYDEALVLFDAIWVDDDLKDILDLFDGKVVVILDCCHSGGMMPCSYDENDFNPEDWGNDFSASIAGGNRVVLMACHEDQLSKGLTVGDTEFSHGIFTLGILSGLNGAADTINDDEITVSECYNYAKKIYEKTQLVLYHKVNSTANIYPESPGDLGDIKLVTGITNRPPNKPSKPSGPTDIEAGREYEYKSSVTEPDGDLMSVFFYWGDGNFTIYSNCPSDVTLEPSNSWAIKFSYKIRVIAIDEHGAVSEWSEPLQIGKAKNKQIQKTLENSLLEKLITKHPLILYLFNLIREALK